MPRKTSPLLPATESLLTEFGDRLRLARLRRKLTAAQVAERAGMVPMTLRNLERGNTGVTLGACLAVMQVLGVEQDLNLLLKDDPFGRQLQDATLIPRKPISRNSRSKRTPSSAPAESPRSKPEEMDTEIDWAKDDFLSTGSLASLLQEGDNTGKKPHKRTKK